MFLQRETLKVPDNENYAPKKLTNRYLGFMNTLIQLYVSMTEKTLLFVTVVERQSCFSIYPAPLLKLSFFMILMK